MISEPKASYGSPTLDRSESKNLDQLKNDEFSETERVAFEASVWRKLDRWVLPLCTMFYLLSFLVRFAFRFTGLIVHVVEDL